jgi:hypothetical protein
MRGEGIAQGQFGCKIAVYIRMRHARFFRNRHHRQPFGPEAFDLLTRDIEDPAILPQMILSGTG